MKKLLGTMILLFSLLGSSQANAMAVVDGTANILQGINNTVQTAWKAMDQAWQEAKDTFDKSAWGKQAKDMLTSIEKLQAAIDKAQAVSDKATSLITGVRNVGSINTLLKNNESPGLNVDYKYAPLLPRYYTPTFTCDNNSCTTATTDGYMGDSTQISSKQIREDMKVKTGIVGNNIKKVTNEAAENNAQEIAVIQALAQEAYTQANNRIDTIGKLQDAIDHPLDESKNDAKYIADLQARIQSEHALLLNEQNKLAALAILQQSQRDAYEQRKKEIAAYVLNGGPPTTTLNIGKLIERGLVATVQAAAYVKVKDAYSVKTSDVVVISDIE
jgi:hypothetical protein